MTADARQRSALGKENAHPTLEEECANGSGRTDGIIADGGYPPEAMKALCIVWWLMWAAIFAAWAVG